MNAFVKTTWARIPRPLKILGIVYVTYLALVLLVVTPLLNVFAPKIYREQTGRELQLGKTIWLNPFTLALSLHDAGSVPDQNRLWSIDTLTANVSLASLWRGHLVLDALELRGLSLQIDQTASDRFNFSDILDYRAKKFPASAKAEVAGEPFAIEIDKLIFSATQLGFRAPYASEPIDLTLSDLNFALTALSTAPDKNSAAHKTSPLPLRGNHLSFSLKTLGVNFLREQRPFATQLRDVKIDIPALSSTANSDYSISALDSGGGSVHIKGNAAIDQRTATGQVQLRSISVLPAWQYLANKLAFDMNAAQLDGDIHYAVNWGGTSTGSNTLHYQLDNSQLALRDVQLQARNDSESRVQFSTLQVSNIQVDSTQPHAQIGRVLLDKPSIAGWNKDTHVSLVDMFAFAASEEKSDSPPWNIQVDEIAFQNGSVHWRASQLDQLPLALAPLDMHARNLRWPDAAPQSTVHESMTVDATTTLNDTAKIALKGAITPSTQSGELHAEVNNLPLIWGDVFVREQMHAILAGGALNARATIKLENAQPVAVHSDGAIDQFELQTDTDKRKLATWKKLEWQQLALELPQRRVDIKRVILTQPWAQFRINTDGTNNFQQLMKTSSAPTAKIQTTALTPALSRGERGLAAKGESSKPWQFALDNVHVDNATIDFRDTSLARAFRTNITELSGDIDGLNSDGKKPAKVGLHGTVDGYAPVALTGKVVPFAAKPELNVTLDITNLDLATLTPYSGTYAGYQIDSGRLSVQLAYTLENERIKGTNHIVVNQMQLGKQVSGPKVMDLPLRFAIYLLTDSNGVMDLGVDVTGNVGDPNFSVGSIIWKAFRNVIVKTATSPFRALARIAGAGGRDDLNRVEFPAGSDRIATGETEKLQTLTTALQKKSALKLNITGHVSPGQDIEAMRDDTLSQQLIKQGAITTTDIQQQSKNWQREVVKLFKKRFPSEKSEQLQVMQMNDAMRDNVELEPSALQDLAAHRALAVKQLLVADMGLAADRAFVKPADLGADKNPGLQATMEVE